MKNKKVIYILGACALALVTSSAGILNCLLDRGTKEAKASTGEVSLPSETPIQNIVLYTDGERDYSDLSIEANMYWINGDLVGVDKSRYDQIVINAIDGAITRIRLRDYNDDSTLYTLLDEQTIDRTFLQKVYLLQGSINNMVISPLDRPVLVNDSNSIYRFLSQCFEVSIKPVADQFSFNQQINYYAPYSANVSSQFVSDSTMTENSSHTEKYYDEVYNESSIQYGGSEGGTQWFTCAGEYYNEIKLYYVNAIAMSFDPSGEPLASNGFASYTLMLYTNTITNKSIVANTRDYKRDNRTNVVGYYQCESSSWASPSYKVINLLFTPTEQQMANLNRLNNSNYSGNSLNVDNSKTTLGDAMGLLALGFQATTSLFTIQVLPGISLGLLLFLPLIAGIIVFVIWVVKR